MNNITPSDFSIKLADRVRAKNISLLPKHNTLFTAANEFGRYSELTVKAIEGLVQLVTRDVNMFRNDIIPTAESMAKEVATKSKLASVNITDKFNIIVHNRSESLQILTDLKLIDTNISSRYTDLPDTPLIIDYIEDVAKTALSHPSVEVSKHIEAILQEHDKDYLINLYDKYLSNISKHNPNMLTLQSNVHDTFILYILVSGFIQTGIGVTNIGYEEAKVNYLYTLRNILSTMLVAHDSIYSNRLSLGMLVYKLETIGTKYTVHLLGESYDKYLENGTIEGIMGAVLSNPQTNYTLDDIVSNYDRYLEVYESKLRLETIKASSDRINLLRQVYKMVTEDAAKTADIDYNAVREYSDEYLNNLSNDKLLDVTNVCRVLSAYYLYRNPEFFTFTDAMDYYSKLSPKSPPEEIATMAMVSLTVNYLKKQYESTEG